jgi:hypothetical protein
MNSFTYINTTTLQYPLFQGDIRLDFPDMGDEFVLPDGYAEIVSTPWPEDYDSDLFRVVELAPENVNGVWMQRFDIVAKTETEIENEKNFYLEFVKQNNDSASPDLTASGSAPNVIG